MQILETLQKLISHEQSARTLGNEAEAAAFAAKIQSLLFRHNLSMSDVRVNDEPRSESVDDSIIEGRDKWRGILMNAIAKSMFCRVIKTGELLHVIGTETNRQAAISLYMFLASTGKGLADRSFSGRSLRNSYLLGFAGAIYHRLESQTQALTVEASRTGNALVYVQRNDSALAGYVQNRFGRTRTIKTRSRINSHAYAAGQAHGNRISLSARAALVA
jgi:hypothetical protein